MTNVEHIRERKYFYWATWEGWMNLFLLSYPKLKYIIKYIQISYWWLIVIILWRPCHKPFVLIVY